MRITAPLLRGDGNLHIVGSEHVVSVEDPDGAMQRLVELADGLRSVDELFSALAPEFPSLLYDDVVDVVAALERAGVFENWAPRGPVVTGPLGAQLSHQH